jgi:hypothetical protein
MAVAQIYIVHDGNFVEVNSLPFGNGVERFVDCWEMAQRQVADEGPLDFVVSDAAVHPSKENRELRAERYDGQE